MAIYIAGAGELKIGHYGRSGIMQGPTLVFRNYYLPNHGTYHAFGYFNSCFNTTNSNASEIDVRNKLV
jgi:hypothetical protein